MSRIAKQPITIPTNVDVKMEGQVFSAKGPRGQLQINVHEKVGVEIINREAKVYPLLQPNKKVNTRDKKFQEAILGTMRSILNSIVIGVNQGYQKKLLLIGVGYRGQVQNNKLNLSLGYSHPIEFSIPVGIKIEMPVPTEIIVSGTDKQLVGQVAANIRAKRPVEPYKGKGIRYSDEKISLKETKKK